MIPKPLTLSPPADAVSATLVVTGDIASVHLIATGDASVAVTYQVATPPSPPPAPVKPTATEAARFLMQAGLSATEPDIAVVQNMGYAGWTNAQIAKPRAKTFVQSLIDEGYSAPTFYGRDDPFDRMIHRHIITTDEHLRTTTAMALANFLVIGFDGAPAIWRPFTMGSYVDILFDHAFGNYSNILMALSRSAIMAWYLSFLNSKQANAAGRVADENYARELMQLFSIGPVILNPDGTPTDQPAYTNDDIRAVARIMTGWTSSKSMTVGPYDTSLTPCILVEADHDLGEKLVLGKVVSAYDKATDGTITQYANRSLERLIYIVFNHPNVGPFVAQRMIQDMVTSNPSPAYVKSVADAFAGDGKGIRGDMAVVVRAVLLHSEARTSAPDTQSGKLREPLRRFYQWARTAKLNSPSGRWLLYEGWNSGRMSLLGQWFTRTPGVFGHFRPGYSPPNTEIADRGLVAPEFQIANELTVITYVNFMQVMMRDGFDDCQPDYSEWTAIAGDVDVLLARLNLVFAANQIGAATIAIMRPGLLAMTDLKPRVMSAMLLVMASPEYLVMK